MAFHSKYSNRQNHRGYRTSETESILGLSGWLFADLLLAIAIIFLVIQSRPGTDDTEKLQAEVARLQEIERQYENLQKTVGEGAKGGLLADPSEQLVISINRGSTISSSAGFKRALLTSEVVKGKNKTTLSEIEKQNLRVGFVLWFTPSSERSQSTSKRNLKYLISALRDMNLVTDQQLSDPQNLGQFPCLCNYNDKTVRGNDLKLRIFLYPLLGKK